MKQSIEEKTQEEALRKLSSHELYPFSVIFTYSGGIPDGLLSITFFSPQDIDRMLEVLDYQNQCDKSGYFIVREYSTIVLSGIALINFYTHED